MNAGKVSSVVCAGVLVFAGLTGGALRAETPAYGAASYVQDGLVGLWDAEENAGFGQHEDAPDVWKDLSGQGRDMTVTASGQFSAKGFKKVAGGLMAYRDEFIEGVRTVEVVISDVPVGEWAVAVYATNRQMIAVKDNVDGQNATNRQIIVSYWNSHGHNTHNRPKVSSISVLYDLNSKGQIVATGSRHCGLDDDKVNDGMEPSGGGLCVGCRYGSESYRGEYKVTGYVVHSIRLYNRQLTDAERQRNLFVDNLRFGSPTYTLDALDCVWTGAAGDRRFSSPGNWQDGWMPVTDVTRGNLILAADGDTTVTNDIGTIRVKGLYVSQTSDATKTVTVDGSPIVLASVQVADKDKTQAALQALCPLTVNADVTFAGTTSAQYYEANVVYNGTVAVESTETHKLWSANNASATFNKSVFAPQTELKTAGTHDDFFYGPVTARLLSPGTGAAMESFHFYATGNSWESRPLIYGAVTANGDNVLPANLVFRWSDSSGSDYKDNGMHRYILRGDQTCDRIESAAVVSSAGAIRWRNRIHSDTRDVTLTLKGTANATSYGALVSDFSKKLNLVWDPVGNYTQTVGDIQQSMIGEIVVKGGTFASAGTNSFPKVTAVRVADGATFAVTASDYNAAANPFPGKTDLWVSGAGKVSVPAGVTATFSSGLVRGVLQAVGTYQALDGTDGTAKKVGWVVGEGLVRISACDGTSWADASVSGDWNDPANWSNGLPNPAKPVYLTSEGGAYAVTMKDGDVWPQNLVIRGANAKLVVDIGQAVAFDGSSVTASVSIEEGGTLSVAGSLTLTEFKGTFAIGSTTSATSRLEVVTGGSFFYTPRYQNAYPIAVNVGGAVDVAGGVLTVPTYGSSANALALKGGALLSSGTGQVVVGPDKLDPKEDWASVSFGVGIVDFGGTTVVTNRGKNVANVTLGPSAAGETLQVTFRDAAVYGLRTDGLTVGSPSTTTRLAFESSSVEHGRLGYRLRVRAEGETGEAELRVSNGKVWNDGRGLDVADDNKADVVTHGRLVQTGGWINNRAANGGWTDQGKPNGLTIGYGANAPGTAGCVAFGEMFLSGGTNQNVNGVTLVGTGYGEGTVVQTGGFNWHDSTSEVFGIGVAGGLGRWTVSNGTLRVKADAYIGGFYTNLLTKAENLTRWPDTRHSATGTLVVAGGTVDFQKNLVLGADGIGTVERIGTDGTFTVGGDLVFSNHVENAQSGGALKLVCTANGVKPVNVTGTARFCADAKMSVDVSGWTNVTRRQWLLKASELENPIAADAVEVTGRTEATREAVVKLTSAGYSVGVPRGMTFVVR